MQYSTELHPSEAFLSGGEGSAISCPSSAVSVSYDQFVQEESNPKHTCNHEVDDFKAKIEAISSDTHQLHHILLYNFYDHNI